MLPADHFVCEKNSLHLWVSDMVAALILNDLEKMRQNVKKSEQQHSQKAAR